MSFLNYGPKETIKIISTLFKSLVSAYTQILYMLVAIIFIRTKDTEVLNIPNLQILENTLVFASQNWLELLLTISVFYFIINYKTISPSINKANKLEDGDGD